MSYNTRRSLALLLAIATSPVLIQGCASPNEEVDDAADALITFPAPAYAAATPIGYGATLTRQFLAADKFVAVKFTGTKGDIVRFQVTAPRAAVSYLVFNQRNVAALRDVGTPAGTFRYTLRSSGEHFIMMRTRDRNDAPITVKLEAISASGAGAFSNADIVANTDAGGAPSWYFPQLLLRSVDFRECVTATGCGPSQRRINLLKNTIALTSRGRQLRQLPEPIVVTQQLWAPPTGIVGTLTFTGSSLAANATGLFPIDWSLVAENAAPWHQKFFDGTSSAPITGKVTLTLLDGGIKNVAFDYTVTYDKTRIQLTLRSEVTRAGVQWSEYSSEIEMPIPALRIADRPPSPPAPRDGGIAADGTPLDDEEVLSRFAAGSVELPVFTPPSTAAAYAASFGVGYEGTRHCAPRTGCSAWTKQALDKMDSDGRRPGEHILAQPFGFGTPMTVKLRVTGDDSYEVVVGNVRIAIENGVGAFTAASSYSVFGVVTYKVKVTAQGLLFEAPFEEKVSTQDAEFPALPSGDRTDRENGYRREYYWNPAMLVRFNQNW